MYAIRCEKYQSFVQVNMLGEYHPELELDYADLSRSIENVYSNDRMWVGSQTIDGAAIYVTEDIDQAKATLELLIAADDTTDFYIVFLQYERYRD